jgi:putative membrane protein
MFEIMSSKAALDKATSEEAKAFAEHMVADHTKAGEEMKPAAEAEGVTVPETLGEKHQAQLDQLTPLDGDNFDQAYISAQLAAHEEAVALFKAYSTDGAPGALKEFAAKTLPTLEAHLEEVQKLKQ